MFEVQCTGCDNTFQVDERRVPRNGMTMRCPKCQTTFVVRRPEGTLAAGAQPKGPPAFAVPPPPPPPAQQAVPTDEGAALPFPADLRPGAPGAPGLELPPIQEPVGASHGIGGAAGRGLAPQKRTLMMSAERGNEPAPPEALAPPPVRPQPSAPPPRMEAILEGFEPDELDIPLVEEAVTDLPAVAERADLPAVAERADLPAVAERAGLPAVADRAGLPAVADRAGLPAISRNVGLPVPSAGLPSPGGVGYPAPSAGGYPAPSAGGYPAPSAGGYPAPSAGGYPAPSAGGYPAPSAGGYPTPSAGGYPTPSAGGYPTPSAGGYPTPSTEGYPAASVGGYPATNVAAPPSTAIGRIGLERKAFAVGPEGALRDLPADVIIPAPLSRAATESVGNRPGRGVGATFGELDLDESAEPQGQAGDPYDFVARDPGHGAQHDFGTAPAAMQSPQEESGTEFDQMPLTPEGAAPTQDDGSFRAETPRPAREARRPATPSSNRKMLLVYGALGFLGLVGVGGGALALTEYGAFGKNWIDEQLNGPERHAAATRVIQQVDRMLERDTFDRAMAAVRRLDEAIERVPQERELKAYAAYVNGWVSQRFGPDPTRVGRARVLLQQLQQGEYETVPYQQLALAADTLARGNAREALRLARSDPHGHDLATLAAESLGDQAQWLRFATQGRQRRATARSRYQLARAQYAASAWQEAQTHAVAVLEIEPRHAGARVLLARVLMRSPEGRARALEFLAPVVRGSDSATGAAGAAGAAALTAPASVGERAQALVVAGQIEFLRDHVTVAQSRFQRALELDPRSAAALVGVGNILYRQGNFTDAMARFRNAMTADRNNLDAVVGVVQTSLALNQPADARGAIEPAVRDHPNDGRLQYWLGRALAASTDQRSLAQQAFRRAMELQPDNLDAYVALAELLIQLQRNDAAEQVLNEARARVPDDAAIHRALAHGRLARGDLAGAETELQEALRRDRDDIRTHFALGDVYRRQGRLDDAERALEQVARVDPAYPGLSMLRGQVAEAQGRLPQALATFREALARDSTNIDLINRVAATLVLLGNYGDADQMLRSAVVDHPTNAETQYLMGRAKLGAGNYQDSMHYLDRALELNPQRADYMAYAAEAHQRLGDIARALQFAERSIELDASFPRGYWVRASIRVHQGAAREALADINRAVQYDRNFWEAYATWAEIDDALGQPDEAIRLYEMATQHDNRHGDWFYNLGRLRADRGREDAARAALNQARTLGAGLSPAPSWFVQGTRLLADLERARNPTEARRLYLDYLRLVPPNSPGYNSVVATLADLNGR